MAVKTATHEVTYNGRVAAETLPTSRKVGGFQAKYLRRLVGNFERAKAAVEAAQGAANEFITAIAEDEGITLGQDGWTFDVDNLEFVRVPPQEG